jgi:hydroxymethylpyrimidine/phosphomethylpyrimidine kinase
MAKRPQALTIATSDSGGGAGIQADIKAIHANGVFALSVVVAITAQNTRSVTKIHPLPSEIIEAQIDAVYDDFEIGAVKTGMLFSEEIVGIVSKKLRGFSVQNLVIDPVMTSKGGTELLKPAAVEKIKTDLIPLGDVVTPNIFEAEILAGMKVRTMGEAREAAVRIHGLGCRAVLLKGGHLESHPATDLLFDGGDFTEIPGEWIDTPNTHGTGCTYSAAVAAQLAGGKPLPKAVRAAKHYVTEAIRHGLSIGHGHGPTDHFYFLKGDPP